MQEHQVTKWFDMNWQALACWLDPDEYAARRHEYMSKK